MSKTEKIMSILTGIFCVAMIVIYYVHDATCPICIAESAGVETTAESITVAPTETEPYSAICATTELSVVTTAETVTVDLYSLTPDELNTYTPTEAVKYLKATATEPATESEPRYSLTDDEQHMICFVSDSEDFTSVESRLCVMTVIMNRLNNPSFPDTVADVLYAPKQFACMKRYTEDYTPSDGAKQALEQLLYGEDILGGEALYFARADIKSSKIARGLYLVRREGNSNFYGQVAK